MQAYNGIHLPKSMEDADLARKRLIFDEFFYMQVVITLFETKVTYHCIYCAVIWSSVFLSNV